MSPLHKISLLKSVFCLTVAATVVSDSTQCGPEEFACADGSRLVVFLLEICCVGHNICQNINLGISSKIKFTSPTQGASRPSRTATSPLTARTGATSPRSAPTTRLGGSATAKRGTSAAGRPRNVFLRGELDGLSMLCTASLSHLRTMLPESCSQPLPARKCIHAT